jgi:hypothetical protein
MKHISITLATAFFAIALPVTAAAQHHHEMNPNPRAKATTSAEEQDRIFISYEEARQALIKGSLQDLRKAAKHIAIAADRADQHKLSQLAAGLENASDLAVARKTFAAVSDEVIKYRESRCCKRPIVVYCSMEKKSWLQPEGQISNPYVDASMRKCGEIKQQ